MTISDNYDPKQYTATSSQTVFPYTWKIFETSDLKVYQTPAGQTSNDAADLLTLTTHYTVSIAVDPNDGGNVTLVTGATTNDIITIDRNVAASRNVDYITAGSFTAVSFNTSLEKSRAVEQQIESLVVNRGLSYSATTNLTTPSGADHNKLPKLAADQIWKMNDAGTVIGVADSDEDTGWSTLRSDLLDNDSGTDGAGRVGYNNATSASDNTVRLAITDLYARHTKVEVSTDDTTPKFLEDAITAGTYTTTVTQNPGANENVKIDAPGARIGAFLESSDNASSNFSTTQIPVDNTKPQITEGNQIYSQAFKADTTASTLNFTFSMGVNEVSQQQVHIIAFFRVGVSDALAAFQFLSNITGGSERDFSTTFSIPSPSNTTETYKVRVGGSAAAGTIYINSLAGGAVMGGASAMRMTITEILD